jgi:hypothetical protein
VLITSWNVACVWFKPRGEWLLEWKPTMAQSKSVSRAMHSFCRKFPQYALGGGKGRRHLYLYEPGDPVSAMWFKLNDERRGGNPICLDEARKAVAKAVEAVNQLWITHL